MSQNKKHRYFLLDRHQGRHAVEGWHIRDMRALRVTTEGLGLALSSTQPKLSDVSSLFPEGIKNPTGATIASDGTIYIADGDQHLVFKLTQYPELKPAASFFLVGEGDFAGDRFVYMPSVHRLERWPSQASLPPDSYEDVEVINDAVWDEWQARRELLEWLEAPTEAWIVKTWQGDYPPEFPAGDLCAPKLSPLPCLGGLGNAARQFNTPRGLAVSAKGELYVADTHNHRVQVFGLRGLTLKAIWGKASGSGTELGEFCRPWDVAVARDGNVFIADTGNHRLQRYDPQRRRFHRIDGTTLHAHYYQVLYGPEARSRFVYLPACHRLERWPSAFQPIPTSHQGTEVLNEALFSEDAAREYILKLSGATGPEDILVDWVGDYPESLTASLIPEPGFEQPTHLAVDPHNRIYVVDTAKVYVTILDAVGRVLGYVRPGVEDAPPAVPTALAIDATGQLIIARGARLEAYSLEADGPPFLGIYALLAGACHGLLATPEGKLYAFGPGLAGLIEVPPPQALAKQGRYVSQGLDSQREGCQWHKLVFSLAEPIPIGTQFTVWTYTADEARSADEIDSLLPHEWQTAQSNPSDCLILSPPGRWLWLKIDFQGDGVATPILKSVKAFYPRETYLQYLPAVYQADPDSKDFLERFLSIFETLAQGTDDTIDHIAQYFDPDGVSEEFLPWLMAWVKLMVEADWPIATKRRLLRHAPELYRWRGTPQGLKQMLKLAFGLDVQILEQFRLRQWIFLNTQSTLGSGVQLWGSGVMNRLQLDGGLALGDGRLMGSQEPLLDPFNIYAHKFSVFVPAALSRSEVQEQQIRKVIELEKPAHTQFALCKVEGRFRVGVQSRVGFDTLLGAYPRLVLNYCSTLGYDAVLNAAPEDQGPPAMRVGHSHRVGVTSVVG
jgi:phage tail-like protein